MLTPVLALERLINIAEYPHSPAYFFVLRTMDFLWKEYCVFFSFQPSKYFTPFHGVRQSPHV